MLLCKPAHSGIVMTENVQEHGAVLPTVRSIGGDFLLLVSNTHVERQRQAGV